MLTSSCKVAVIGAGAIGLYYGSRLALGGADVGFLFRRDFSAVKARKSVLLTLESAEFEVKRIRPFQDVLEIGQADLVVVGLKTTQNSVLRSLLPPVMGSKTVVLTLQNGFGADEFIGEIVGREKVVAGLAFIACNRTGEGRVSCFHPGWLLVGALERSSAHLAQSVARVSSAAGIVTKIADNLIEARWRKLIWNGPFNGLAVIYNVTTDVICSDPVLCSEAMAIMRDIQVAAASEGFAIPDEFLLEQMAVTPRMGAYQPSSLVDYRAGKELEINAIWGEPVRQAEANGVRVPSLSALYRSLKALNRT